MTVPAKAKATKLHAILHAMLNVVMERELRRAPIARMEERSAPAPAFDHRCSGKQQNSTPG